MDWVEVEVRVWLMLLLILAMMGVAGAEVLQVLDELSRRRG